MLHASVHGHRGRFSSTGRQLAAATATFALVLTACGQKAGVHVEGSNGGIQAAAPVGGEQVVQGDQQAAAPTTTSGGGDTGTTTPSANAPGSAAAPTTSTPSGTTQAPGSSPGSSTTDGQAPQQAPAGTSGVTGSDRTGVTEDTILLGSHAPVTGAAPLPSTSFEKSGDLYWRHLVANGGDVLGRTNIRLTFRDDRYDPASAIQVCRELAAEVFTFAGGGGTDQIQACGSFANRAQVPYFSAGVTEAGLTDNPWYFASSMSYRQQAYLLANFVRSFPETAGKKVAAVITDTPNFDDAISGWEDAVAKEGLDYYDTLTHPKGDTSWHSSYVADLADNGVEVVYILSSPLDYIKFAQQAREAGADFQYVGVGISMGLNAVLGAACGTSNIGGGIFFSPFPGLDWARTNVPEFFEAGQQFGAPTDDIALALWGANKSLHALFEEYRSIYGNDLTREDFRAVVENSSISTNLFPAVSYTPENHFGASTVHVLRANCDENVEEYETLATFASAF